MNDDPTTDELEREYSRTVRERPDDVPATQAVLCILIAAGLFCTALLDPALGAQLFARLTALISAPHELLPNPLPLILH
jgi:hypothetical protein